MAHIHNVTCEEIGDREEKTHDQIFHYKQQVKINGEEIQRLKEEKEVIINERTKDFEVNQILDHAISLAYEEAPKVSQEMLVEEKELWLSKVFADL